MRSSVYLDGAFGRGDHAAEGAGTDEEPDRDERDLEPYESYLVGRGEEGRTRRWRSKEAVNYFPVTRMSIRLLRWLP